MTFKLIDFTHIYSFVEIRKNMNIPLSYRVLMPNPINKFETPVWKDPSFFELEIKPSDVNFKINNDGEMYYDGKKVLVYIRDQSIYTPNPDLDNFKSSYKYHIRWCKTLESKVQDGTYDKYIISTRKDGLFTVNTIIDNKVVKKSEQPLCVCKNCLRIANYKNYINVSQEIKEKIYQEFSLKEFFDSNDTLFNLEPKFTDQDAPENLYTDNWNEISRILRKLNKYKCDKCGMDYQNNIQSLHLHHIDGNKFNNRPSNLKVLCFDCHAKKHPHLKNLKNK